MSRYIIEVSKFFGDLAGEFLLEYKRTGKGGVVRTHVFSRAADPKLNTSPDQGYERFSGSAIQARDAARPGERLRIRRLAALRFL